MLFEARGDCSEVLQFIEETLDEVTEAVEERAEGGNINPSRHRLDIGPAAARCHVFAQRIAIVGAVSEKDLTLADVAQHICSAAAIVGLAFRQLQCDRKAIGIDKSMNFRCQAAPRAPHASGVSVTPSGGVRFF